MLAGIEVVFALLLGHVARAIFCAVHDVLGVLKGLLHGFGVLTEPFPHARVCGLLGRVSTGEPQVLSKLEVHVRTAVRGHACRLHQNHVLRVGDHLLGSFECVRCTVILRIVLLLGRLQLFKQLFVVLGSHSWDAARALHAVASIRSIRGDRAWGIVGKRITRKLIWSSNIVGSPSCF